MWVRFWIGFESVKILNFCNRNASTNAPQKSFIVWFFSRMFLAGSFLVQTASWPKCLSRWGLVSLHGSSFLALYLLCMFTTCHHESSHTLLNVKSSANGPSLDRWHAFLCFRNESSKSATRRHRRSRRPCRRRLRGGQGGPRAGLADFADPADPDEMIWGSAVGDTE